MAIGYVLLVPSILGVLGGGGGAMLSVVGGAVMVAEADPQKERQAAEEAMREAGVPDSLAARVSAGQDLTLDEQASLGFAARIAAADAEGNLRTDDQSATP